MARNLHDFKKHNQRHEGCCRGLELGGKEGRWLYSELKIYKMLG